MTDKRIVVVGAGFGGLRAALSLWQELKHVRLAGKYGVTLVDRSDRHAYTPLLYKLATDPRLSLDRVGYPLSQLLAPTGIHFIAAEAREFDLARGFLYLGNSEKVRADYLVLAPGSETNYFNIPGLKESALPLKTIDDALELRARLRLLPDTARVLIGGGGPTGVELAGALRGAHRFKVTLVEAMPTLLSGFHPRLQELATRRLMKLGVEVLTNTPIAGVKGDAVITKDGVQHAYDLLVWTGGVKVPEWVPKLPLKTEPRGRLEVKESMDCIPVSAEGLQTGSVKIYAMGDAVCVHDAKGNPLPGVAPAAIDQGEVIARNILQDILAREGREHDDPLTYRPITYPYVLPVGPGYAIGILRSFILHGLTAWALKEIVEIDYRMSVMPFWKAVRRNGI